MKRFWILKGLKFLTLLLALVAAAGWVVMSLWNWLMPVIFGLTAINFWQALGLLLLSKILFGGFKGGSHRGWEDKKMQWKQKMTDRFSRLSPEEQAKFREKWERKCGKSWSWPEAPATTTE